MNFENGNSCTLKTSSSAPDGSDERYSRVQFGIDSDQFVNGNHTSPGVSRRKSNISGYLKRVEADQARICSEHEAWEGKNVLVLDGGGIRGYTSLLMLKKLMAKIEQYEREAQDIDETFSSADSPTFHYRKRGQASRIAFLNGKYLPCHYFDYICGASTGGLNAVFLGRLRMDIDEAIDSFQLIWKKSCPDPTKQVPMLSQRKRKKSQSIALTHVIKTCLNDRKKRLETGPYYGAGSDFVDGQNFEFDEKLCRTIVTALPDNNNNVAGLQTTHLFRTYCQLKSDMSVISAKGRRISDSSSKLFTHDVCAASIALRGHFKGVRIGDTKYRDSGILRNNPGLDILSEIEQQQHERPVRIFVSLGTGQQDSHRSRYAARREQSIVQEDFFAKLQLQSRLGERYRRFEGPSDVEFDSQILETQSSPGGIDETFATLEKMTKMYCRIPDVAAKIDICARDLVQTRRARAKTSLWEQFALGMQYTCFLPLPQAKSRDRTHENRENEAEERCKGDSRFVDRDTFIEHLMFVHNYAPPDQDEANWNEVQSALQISQNLYATQKILG